MEWAPCKLTQPGQRSMTLAKMVTPPRATAIHWLQLTTTPISVEFMATMYWFGELELRLVQPGNPGAEQ